MTQINTQHFSATDPREFDGDPFEVADRAVAQIKGVIDVALTLAPATILMVRNAELERRIIRDEDPDAAGWPETTEGRRWSDIEADLRSATDKLTVLQRVAAFNPKRAG